MMKKNKIKYPELYQGRKNPGNYFEGWYFRHTTGDRKHSLIVIPGVSCEPADPHSFIQIITGSPQKTYYVRFDISDFDYSLNDFELNIGDNFFSHEGVRLNIHTDEISLETDLSYGVLAKIDTSFLSPNIMGPFAYIPRMECNHGVISLRHDVSGSILLNGNKVFYNKGRGYIEKDWGKSFPEKYIWMQSNHFKKNSDFFLSLARIPFLGLTFTGLIALIRVNGRQYRFATYNGAKFNILRSDDNGIHLELSRSSFRLVIKARNSSGHVLKAPRRGRMTDEITETLTGEIEIALFDDGKLIHSDNGTNLGLEIMWNNT